MRQLTNTAGAVTDTYEYDAWGNEVNSTGTTSNSYLYRAEQYDSDLGLYYLRARYYNSVTGRFLSRDPKGGYPLIPDTLHKYLYAGGNPTNRIDPSGRDINRRPALLISEKAFGAVQYLNTLGCFISIVTFAVTPEIDPWAVAATTYGCVTIAFSPEGQVLGWLKTGLDLGACAYSAYVAVEDANKYADAPKPTEKRPAAASRRHFIHIRVRNYRFRGGARMKNGESRGDMNLQSSNHGTPTVPRELAGPLPRKVEMDSTDARFLFAVVLIFLVGGAISCGWYTFNSIKQAHQRTALRSDGRKVVGEVTGLSLGRGGKEFVKYSFTFEGKKFLGKARIPGNSGIVLHQQDQILIRFLPLDPAVNHPYAWEWSALMNLDSIGFQLFCAVIIGIALIFLRRERRLAREGKAVPGVVTSCTRKDRQFRVDYDFRTEDGILMTGGSGCKDFYETGTHIWILYLPQRPRRNRSYPLPDYRIIE